MACCNMVFNPPNVPVCIPNSVTCYITCCMPCCPAPCCPPVCCPPCPPCPPKEEKTRVKEPPPPAEPRQPRKSKKILPCYYTKPSDKRSQYIKFDEMLRQKLPSCSSL